MRISDWSADVCSSDLTPDAIRRDADAALNVCKRHSLASLRAVSSSTRCSDKTLWKSCHKCPGDMVSKSASSCWMRWTSRSEEHTSELQSLMRISYAVFCLKKKNVLNTTLEKKKNTK